MAARTTSGTGAVPQSQTAILGLQRGARPQDPQSGV